MILGTHTSDGEQNYLMVASIQNGIIAKNANCKRAAKGWREITLRVSPNNFVSRRMREYC